MLSRAHHSSEGDYKGTIRPLPRCAAASALFIFRCSMDASCAGRSIRANRMSQAHVTALIADTSWGRPSGVMLRASLGRLLNARRPTIHQEVVVGNLIFKRVGAVLSVVMCARLCAVAQNAPTAEFDVVSIKKNAGSDIGSRGRTMPDGTTILVNQTIRSIVPRGAGQAVRDVEGLPGWAMDRYDLTVKPPADASADDLRVMWQRMLADRMKLAFHIRNRETDGFALVVARPDGRLGSGLKPSSLNCTARREESGKEVTTPETGREQCQGRVAFDRFVFNGVTLGTLSGALASVVGAPVEDQTGVNGYYDLDFRFTRPDSTAPAVDDVPVVFVALEEQLGLKLRRTKLTIPVMVVDHIERPSEN